MDKNPNLSPDETNTTDISPQSSCPVCGHDEFSEYYDETILCHKCGYHEGISKKEFLCPDCGSLNLFMDNNHITCSSCGCEVILDCSAIEQPSPIFNRYKLIDVKQAEILPGIKSLNLAFSEYTKLEKVILPEGIQKIGLDAFNGCINLQEINLPESIQIIEAGAFTGSSVRKIKLPENITQIYDFTFNCCFSLEHILIPETVESIGPAAFQYCTSLREITIPASVKIIQNSAFYGCTALEQVRILNPECNIDPSAFKNCPKVNIEWK